MTEPVFAGAVVKFVAVLLCAAAKDEPAAIKIERRTIRMRASIG
jgi:hypothetical protein